MRATESRGRILQIFPRLTQSECSPASGAALHSMSAGPEGPACLSSLPLGHFLYLELDVVAYELVALHELLLVAPVLCDHGEGMVDRSAQDAHQRLDTRVRVHIRQVGLHDVAGSQPAEGEAGTASKTPQPLGTG